MFFYLWKQKEKWETKKSFWEDMVLFMVEESEIPLREAMEQANKFIDRIDTEDYIVQHIGPHYFAIKILMYTGYREYKPM